MFLTHKELRSQVLLRNSLMIQDGQATNACQYQVLGNLVCQCLDSDQEDVRGS